MNRSLALLNMWNSASRSLLSGGPKSFFPRFYSSTQKTIVKHDSDSGISTVYLNNPPVNGLDNEMLNACTSTIKSLEKDSNVKGVILTSNFNGKVFSAGLNILDMFQKSNDHLIEFWTNVQDWYLAWYGCKKPTVALINGHSPAGGCAFSLMCDYRIMQSGGSDVKTIGLNETQLGIVAPFFFVDLMVSTIGRRKSYDALLKGGLYPAEEALEMGLVDKLAPLETLHSTAETELKKFLKVPSAAYGVAKLELRQDVMERLLKVKQKDAEDFAKFVSQPLVQNNIGEYLQRLKGKK